MGLIAKIPSYSFPGAASTSADPAARFHGPLQDFNDSFNHMHRTRQEVIDEIRNAFRRVRLGDGVGLYEGGALDDWADDATCRAARIRDERELWEAIPKERLVTHHDAICFLDAEGMRFHLPAFMIAELNGAQVSCIFHLTELSDWARGKLALLNPQQRQAVREFLLFVLDEQDYWHHRKQIKKSLSEYWNVEPPG